MCLFVPQYKRKNSKKELIVAYNEDERKRYLTGFTKRKNERRKKAEGEQEARKRRKKIDERKMKREALQMKISTNTTTLPDAKENIDQDEPNVLVHDGSAKEITLEQQVYEQQQTGGTITTTISEISFDEPVVSTSNKRKRDWSSEGNPNKKQHTAQKKPPIKKSKFKQKRTTRPQKKITKTKGKGKGKAKVFDKKK